MNEGPHSGKLAGKQCCVEMRIQRSASLLITDMLVLQRVSRDAPPEAEWKVLQIALTPTIRLNTYDVLAVWSSSPRQQRDV